MLLEMAGLFYFLSFMSVIHCDLYFKQGPYYESHLTDDDFQRAKYVLSSQLYKSSGGKNQPGYRSDLFEGDIANKGLNSKNINSFVNNKKTKQWNTLASGSNKLYIQPQRNAIRERYGLWPSGVVPYTIASTYSSYSRSILASALAEYSRLSCIRFVPRLNERSYLKIVPDDGCYSTVGREGAAQTLSLGVGCLEKGVIIHELLHALGFFHEQSRPDRDHYVKVLWTNIQPTMIGQFDKYSVDVINNMGIQYDYRSIMHYGAFSFTKNGNMTLVPNDANAAIGQRVDFSELDLLKLNKLYACPGYQSNIGPDPSQPLCQDQRSDCSEYKAYCMMRGWVQKECAQTCNTCVKPYKPIVTCRDQLPDCDRYHQMGYCTTYSQWMRQQCPQSCGMCSVAPAPVTYATFIPKPTCYDQHSSCSSYAQMGYCELYKGYMSEQCRLTCNLCQQTVINTTPVPVPCADQAGASCALYMSYNMCTTSAQFMNTYCAASCGFCTSDRLFTTTPVPLTVAPFIACVDKRTDCAYQASTGACHLEPVNMSFYCSKTCGMCQSNNVNGVHITKNGLRKQCQDISPQCSTLHYNGPNQCTYIMQQYCKRTCNVCT